MKRKDFLKYSAGSFFIPSFLHGFGVKQASGKWMHLLANATVETDKVLVLVRLDGGNDGLNTVIPLDQYSALSGVRSTVVLPENKVLKLNGTDQVGLHPAMTHLRDLYNEGLVKIVQSVGYPNPNYSHFRSTDIWMTGADSDQVLGTGWAGRYLHHEFPNFPAGFPNAEMPDPLSLEIGSFLSLAFHGPSNAMGMSVTDPAAFQELIGGGTGMVPNTPAGEKLKYVRLVKQQSNAYGVVIKNAFDSVTSQGAYPDNNDLAQQLKIVAKLIAGGLKTRIYMVSIGGFDTHDSQVDPSDQTKGEHAGLLGKVSEAIGAFMNDLEYLGIQNRVTGMTFSEFGRRIISNFSTGTDHGAAAPLFIFGHSINGGILGDNPTIPANAGEDDNLPMQYDFRSVYATMLQDWFCVPAAEISDILLRDHQILPIVRSSDCVTTEVREQYLNAGKSMLSAYPNPFVESTTITFLSSGGPCMVQVFNGNGQLVTTPVNGTFAEGEHWISWNSEELPAGNYHIRFQHGVLQQVKSVIKVR